MRNSLAFFLILSGVICCAQKKAEASVRSRISAGNFLYIGLDNIVSITVKGIPPSSIAVSGNGGGVSIRLEKDSIYSLRVSSPDSVKITVGYKKGGKTVSAGTFSFKPQRVPMPDYYAGCKKMSDGLQRTSIPSALSVKVGCDLSQPFKVLSFTIEVSGKKYFSENAAFTDEMKKALKSQSVKSFRIKSCKVQGPDGIKTELGEATVPLT